MSHNSGRYSAENVGHYNARPNKSYPNYSGNHGNYNTNYGNYNNTTGKRHNPWRQNRNQIICRTCGKYNHISINCKAHIKCHACHKYGHYKYECRSNPSSSNTSRKSSNNYRSNSGKQPKRDF